MPTIDIIGYLWTNRQALGLEGLPDVLQMASDLQRTGVEVVRAEDLTVFGITSGASVVMIERTHEEWGGLVESAIIQASVDEFLRDALGGDDE